MSHHFDSPTALEDGRLNLTDIYAFPASGDTTTLIMNVNPDAGRSSPTTLRPDALYEFVVAGDGGVVEDRALRITVDEPEANGRQRMTIRSALGADSRDGTGGVLLGSGVTDQTFALAGGGSAWFGVVGDPFWGDGVALAGFDQSLGQGDYRPDLFGGTPANVFEGRNSTAIALEIPNTWFGGPEVALWARISLHGHAPRRQVSRMGNPMLRPLFFGTPGPESETLNAGAPADDLDLHGARLRRAGANVARLRGFADPEGHGAAIARAFLPDVLTVRPGRPAGYVPGAGNGRNLHDDAFGIALSLLVDTPLGRTDSPHPVVAAFPYLAPADRESRPSLLELFGLRPAAAGSAGEARAS